jgi:uncharacterized membrane protein
MAVILALHLLAGALWVGGMFFAHQALRPAALQLEPPLRLQLWVRTFRRFFPWVWAFIIILPVTGYWMIGARFGGLANVGLHIHIMNGLGLIMILVFLFLFFRPYRALQRHVGENNFQAGAANLATIRRLVGFNLLSGIAVIVIAAGGRLF